MADTADTVDWQGVKGVVFGRGLRESVLARWLQPFTFSRQEPLALVQGEGGPCAVLAPLQAFLLKRCLEKKITCLSSLGRDTVRGLLAGALVEVLAKAGGEGGELVVARVAREVAEVMAEQGGASKRARQEVAMADLDTLHSCLTVETFPSPQALATTLEERWEEMMGTQYDVIAFLYSLVLTKGVERISVERGDAEESLIDPLHGHGSQALINLLLTGTATQNVFDGCRDLCGLELVGIREQSSVGFLSYLECLRYLEVGRHLKCPRWPVWVLGSETHLTVVYSNQLSLVAPPSPREAATEAFDSLAADTPGFIPSDQLGQLMERLGLFSEEGYVDIMKGKLDSEGLGIILLPQFLEEFYPCSPLSSSPDTFTLHHYNGLARGQEAQVVFRRGEAVQLEGVAGSAEGNPLLQTLQTKWRSLAVDWDGGTPSIN